MKDRLFGAGAALLVMFAWMATPMQAQENAVVAANPVPSLAPMIEKVSPAVVSIGTHGSIEVQERNNPLFDDPFFRRFFDIPDQFGPQEREFQAAGSGVIVDADEGYIITNAHVVENADEITVTLQDNRQFTAKVLGVDKPSDVALLKADQKNLVDIQFADSSQARVGDYVVAIGNPFGLQHTVTSGIISALGRSGINPTGYEDFIQTDASINPGNSGGALVNLRGELVGINSAIFTRSGGNIGIGFAIPSDMVRNVMQQLVEFGEVRRGLLGVQISNLTPDLAEPLGVDVRKGAVIREVVAGSAASEAGIKAGDVVVAIDGRKIDDANELRNLIGAKRVGDKVDLELIRDGRRRHAKATLTESVEEQQVAAADMHRGLAGAEFSSLNQGSPGYAGTAGVLVTNVAPGSPAALNGLQPNDLITHVNRKRIKSVAEFREIASGGGALALELKRGDSTQLIPIR